MTTTTPDPALVEQFITLHEQAYERHKQRRAEAEDQHHSGTISTNEYTDTFLDSLDAFTEESHQIAEDLFGGHSLREGEIDAATAGKPVFRGSDGVYLREKYGSRVRFIDEVGWLVDEPAITPTTGTNEGA